MIILFFIKVEFLFVSLNDLILQFILMYEFIKQLCFVEIDFLIDIGLIRVILQPNLLLLLIFKVNSLAWNFLVPDSHNFLEVTQFTLFLCSITIQVEHYWNYYLNWLELIGNVFIDFKCIVVIIDFFPQVFNFHVGMLLI
jgi:hypothetical protein